MLLVRKYTARSHCTIYLQDWIFCCNKSNSGTWRNSPKFNCFCATKFLNVIRADRKPPNYVNAFRRLFSAIVCYDRTTESNSFGRTKETAFHTFQFVRHLLHSFLTNCSALYFKMTSRGLFHNLPMVITPNYLLLLNNLLTLLLVCKE